METQCANVLIIDDDAARGRIASESLSSHRNGMDFEVKHAPTSAAALDLIEKEHFDAVTVTCTQEAPAGFDQFIAALRNQSPDSALIALDPAGNNAFHRFGPGGVDDSILTSTSEHWQSFPARMRQIILKNRARETHRRTSRHFEAIVRSAPDVIIAISRTGRILEFNARAEQVWGISRDAAVGSDFLEICFSQQDRFKINCEMQLLEPGESARDLRSLVSSGGRQTALSWDFSFLGAEDGDSGVFVAVAHEIDTFAPRFDADLRKIALNASFNDTVDLVLNSLCAILARIDCINARTTPEVLERLRGSYEEEGQNGRRIPPKTAAAVERLILGLLVEHKQVS